MQPNVLSFELTKRHLQSVNGTVGSSQTPRTFLDVVVDGHSLYDLKGHEYDFITGIWDGNEHAELSTKYLQRLKLTAPADFENDRRSLYVCSECGDLGCGAISVVVRREADWFVWEAFGYQNNYDGEILLEDFEKIGPFRFAAAHYLEVINATLERIRRSSLA